MTMQQVEANPILVQLPSPKRVHGRMLLIVGEQVNNDLLVRCNKVIEEAAELVQSAGMTREQAVAAVEAVFNKAPEPNIAIEFGGVIMSVWSLANLLGVNIQAAAWNEFDRIWSLREKIAIKGRQLYERLHHVHVSLRNVSKDVRPSE